MSAAPSNLADLLNIAPEICDTLELLKAIQTTCQYARESFSADHSAFVLFSSEGDYGQVVSEFPETPATLGTTIPITGVRSEEKLITDREPLVVENVDLASDSNSLQGILRGFGIRSMLVVPVIGKGRVYGSFSVDFIRATYQFSETDIARAKGIAERIARTIAVAEYFDHEHKRVNQLEQLRRTSVDLAGTRIRTDLLQSIVERAANYFKARSAGLYDYLPFSHTLKIVAETNPSRLGTKILLGEGLAGRLMESDEPFMIIDNYRKWHGAAPAFSHDPLPFGAVIGATLKWEGKPLGVLYIDDIEGRKFSAEDGKFLTLYAEQAATALVGLESEQRLRLILRVTTIVTQSDDPNLGLTLVGEALLQGIDAEFSSVVLEEIDDDFSTSTILEFSNPSQRPLLLKLTKASNGPDDVSSMLVIPLRSESRKAGLLLLSKIGIDSPSDFSRVDLELAEAVGSQLTMLVIRRLQLDRYRTKMDQLDEVSRELRSISKLHAVREQIIAAARKLSELTLASLFLVSHADQTLKCIGGNFALPNTRVQLKGTALGEAALTDSSGLWIKGESKELGSAPDLEVQAGYLLPIRERSNKYVLFLASFKPLGEFAVTDLTILDRFASTAGMALETERSLANAALIHDLNEYVQTTSSCERILKATLTTVTANYGLQFNRACILLLDNGILRGAEAIGQRSQDAAIDAWNRNEQDLHDFGSYLRALEKDSEPTTELSTFIRAVRFSLNDPSYPELLAVINEQASRVLSELSLPRGLRQCLGATSRTLVTPLIARNKVTGILVADNCFSQAEITNDIQQSLTMLAKSCAGALENNRLFAEARDRVQFLRSLHQTSNELAITGDITADLKKLVELARQASIAKDVVLIIMNDAERPQQTLSTMSEVSEAPAHADIISLQVFRGKEAKLLSGSELYQCGLNPLVFGEPTGPALCSPLISRKRALGVMWFLFSGSKNFDDSQITDLQYYVNLMAILCGSMLQLRQMDSLAVAVREISASDNVQETFLKLTASAQHLFRADWCTFWPYDAGTERFVPQMAVSAGVAIEELEEPIVGRTTYRILQEGYMEELDVLQTNTSDHEFLRKSAIESFRGIALRVGSQNVGVLYLAYYRKQIFSEDDVKLLTAFAPFAALTISKAIMLDHLRKVAHVDTLVNRESSDSVEKTLQALADNTRTVLNADSVTLYACDKNGEVHYLPALAGVRERQEVLQLLQSEGGGQPSWRVQPNSIVNKILQREDLYSAEDAATDSLFKDKRFRKAENVASCLAAPIRASGEKVGAMFINYAKRHRFTHEERRLADTFAIQAGIAIKNAQFREDLDKLREILELSEHLSNPSSTQKVLKTAVTLVRDRLNTDYANIVLPDQEGRLRFVENAGWNPELIENYTLEHGRFSHAGYTIEQAKPVAVADFNSKDLPFVPPRIAAAAGIVSGMSVPMFDSSRRQTKPVGALLVHTKQPRVFGQADETYLQIVANLTAAAIRNAEDYKRLEDDNLRQSRFISRASHELRTPLAPVPIYVSTMLEGHYGPVTDEQQKVLESVLESMRDERLLIDNMLNLVRLQQGRSPARLAHVSLAELINSTCRLFEVDALQKNIMLIPEIPTGDQLEAQADNEMTKGILRNLVSNAIKFTDVGSVTVRAYRFGAHIRVEVCDTGIGISKEDTERVFDQSVRITNRPGMGIGLGIVREFAKEMQVPFTFSSNVNVGSNFAFDLLTSPQINHD